MGSAAQLADCVHKLQRWRGQHGLGSRGGAHGDARLHAHTRTLRLCWPASNTQRPPPACASQQSNAAAACCCARIPRTAPAVAAGALAARPAAVGGWMVGQDGGEKAAAAAASCSGGGGSGSGKGSVRGSRALQEHWRACPHLLLLHLLPFCLIQLLLSHRHVLIDLASWRCQQGSRRFAARLRRGWRRVPAASSGRCRGGRARGLEKPAGKRLGLL